MFWFLLNEYWRKNNFRKEEDKNLGEATQESKQMFKVNVIIVMRASNPLAWMMIIVTKLGCYDDHQIT